MTEATLTDLYTFPIKGLTGAALDAARLVEDDGMPGDRLFGFAKESSGFDPDAPQVMPKDRFVVLMEHAGLAALRTAFDPEGRRLRIDDAATGETLFEGNMKRGEDRARAADLLQARLDLPAADRPEFVGAAPHRFTDVSVVSPQMMNAVSLLNLASVRAAEDRLGVALDPMRFRANVWFDGWDAFDELDLVGRRVAMGEAELEIVFRTRRCAATEVNPRTAERDVKLPALLRKAYGHFDMGVYAEVRRGGRVAVGDRIELLPDG
jgi:uncharacterized protein YcbX